MLHVNDYLRETNKKQQIRNVLKSWKPPNDTETIELIKNCQHIRIVFMDNFYISETERNFPLAFEMSVYYQQNFLLQKNQYKMIIT